MLADLGADVIKVEPLTGAFERSWSGFDAYKNGISVFFLLGNRNQRSLSIDLRAQEAKEIVYRLVREADVLVENFRPGVLDRLGFGYQKLSGINPRLIYCSISGYGGDGPYVNKPGQDLLIQSMSGLASLSGGYDAPPTPIGTSAVDQHGAVLSAFGIAAALYEREKTNKGKRIESNLLNSALDLQIEPYAYFLNKGPLWERSKNGLSSRFHESPYGVFKTKDSWITISLTPMDKLASALESDILRQYTPADQRHKREEVNKLISENLKTKTTAEWMKIFEENQIWYAPVNEYEHTVQDPQVIWNKMITSYEHPDVGTVKVLSHPLRYDGQVPQIRMHPPRLGEHTEEILEECGFSIEEIEKLLSRKVVNAYKQD